MSSGGGGGGDANSNEFPDITATNMYKSTSAAQLVVVVRLMTFIVAGCEHARALDVPHIKLNQSIESMQCSPSRSLSARKELIN